MELKESLSVVAQLVLDAMGEMKEEQLSTPLAIGLYGLVKKQLIKKEEKKSVISPEIDAKIRELKKAEAGGIAWIDTFSWNLLPPLFQNDFIKLFDPLIIWQGVFIFKLKLDELESQVWDKLPLDLSVYELNDLSNFHLHVISNDRSIYDTFNTNEFKKRREKFESLYVRAIGNTVRGVVIKKRHV